MSVGRRRRYTVPQKGKGAAAQHRLSSYDISTDEYASGENGVNHNEGR